MAAILLVLAVLGLVVLGDAVIENTAGTDLSLFGQHISGLTTGGMLALAAALGALTTCLLLLTFAASNRRRGRRKELRSGQHDLEDRIADLERENSDLRTQPVTAAAAPDRQADVAAQGAQSQPVPPPPPASAPPAAPPPAAAKDRP